MEINTMNTKKLKMGAQSLQKSNKLKLTISALLLFPVSMVMMNDTQATPTIAANNGISDCTVCHQGSINQSTGRAGLTALCGTAGFNSNFVCNIPGTPSPTPAPGTSPTPAPSTDSESDDSPRPRPTTAPSATPTPAPSATPTPTAVPLTVNGRVGSTTSDRAATNVYDVQCGSGTQSLSAAVIDLPPVLAPIISIQLTKGTNATGIASDLIDGDAIYSSWVTLSQGQGHYNMLVSKSRVPGVNGAEIYRAKFYCLDAQGKRTATQAQIKQND